MQGLIAVVEWVDRAEEVVGCGHSRGLVRAGSCDRCVYGVRLGGCSPVGKFFVTSAFTLAYVIVADLFPTPLRALGLGLCSLMAHAGSVVAPFVVENFAGANGTLPLVLCGIPVIVSGVCALALPSDDALQWCGSGPRNSVCGRSEAKRVCG